LKNNSLLDQLQNPKDEKNKKAWARSWESSQETVIDENNEAVNAGGWLLTEETKDEKLPTIPSARESLEQDLESDKAIVLLHDYQPTRKNL